MDVLEKVIRARRYFSMFYEAVWFCFRNKAAFYNFKVILICFGFYVINIQPSGSNNQNVFVN